MPPKLDYNVLDPIISENDHLSAQEIINRFKLPCSPITICRRKKHLGINGAKRGPKIEISDDIDLATPTRCKCPKCGSYYLGRIFWTGNGIPRKFCRDCKQGTRISDVLDLDSHGHQQLTRWINSA